MQQRGKMANGFAAQQDDPEAIFRSLAEEIGQCGQHYEIWEPRMIRAISQYVHTANPSPLIRTALWGKMGYGPDGPSVEDLAETRKQEADAWEDIRRDAM